MMIIGLTGGIATGKSTIAAMFRERGVAIHDADASVHALLGPGGEAVDEVVANFGCDLRTDDGAIDRTILGQAVFKDSKKRQQLERILHPLVARDRDAFLDSQRRAGADFVILDIPLLFEVGSDGLCDYIIVAYARQTIQYERAIARQSMNGEKLDGILLSQIPIADKIEKADFVLSSETSIDQTRAALFSWMDNELPSLLQNHRSGDTNNA